MFNKIIHNISSQKLTKLIFVIFSSLMVISVGFASYESFLDNLRKTGIDVDQILDSNEVSRYEVTRLLNAVNCKDCVNTPQWMVDKYTQPRWNNFNTLPEKDFDDIGFKGGMYKNKMYYYCVAYVGDNIWMRGYPAGLSPICDGKFCGNRNTTVGEFLQVILNIADKYTYNDYSINRANVKVWMDSLEIGSYPDNNLNTDDISLINKLSNENLSGSLPSEASMHTYLKYCMFNLKSCNMQSFGEIVQGYRPVAELNVLYDHNLVEHEKFKNGDIHELVEGKYVLQTLYKLFKIIDCEFNNNYDCDSQNNNEDNCPNNYNSRQIDTDNDGIGDTCDNDIDGDGILNPIGIVDDGGNIVISKWDKNMDNCLFVVNTGQSDIDNNSIGDACENNKNYLGMYIKTSELKTTAPLFVNFEAITQGDIKGDVSWHFGDGGQATGFKISHKFTNEGLYKIYANAEGLNNKAYALTTILVGKNSIDDHAIQIITDKIGGELPLDIKFKADTIGIFDKFEWDFGDGHIIDKQDTKEIIKTFRDQNSYMVTVKGFKNGKVVAVANMILGVGNSELATNMSINNLTTNKGQPIKLTTQINGFGSKDIKSIEWNWGDEEIEINKKLDIEHTYNTAGPRVIIQKIILNNNRELQNFLTINIKDYSLNKSYGIYTSIDNLVINNYENIKFKLYKKGYIPESLLILIKYMDGNSYKDRKNLGIRPKYYKHKYTKKGIVSPKTSVFINKCVSLETIETIVIADNDLCLDAKLNNTLGQYKCDMDNDGIPDICDDDIDGDGSKNLIGLINFEQKDCGISIDNINWDIIKEQNGTCGLDNCPTVYNKDQMDLNNDGRGDSCDRLYYNNDEESNNEDKDGDIDGDGIVDSLDACPLIPENYNGIEDYDGCPEIGANIDCNINGLKYNIGDNKLSNAPKIATPTCFSCPCAFSDYANDIVIDDKVKASLWDFNMDVLYSESIPEPIRQYLN